MAILFIRDTVLNNLSVRNNQIAVASHQFVRLGTPAVWVEPGGPPDGDQVWFLFSDRRFDLEGAAFLGAVLSNLGRIGAQYELPLDELTGEVLEDQMRAEVSALVGVVVPDEIPEGEFPLDYVLKQNTNSKQLFYADAPPVGWFPLEVEDV